MSTITKEWLQNAISQHENMRDEIPFGLDEDDSNTLAALRIALASLEAEPVCVIDQSNLDYLKSGSDADVWPASRTEMGDVLLYRTAQPATVSAPTFEEWCERTEQKPVGWVRDAMKEAYDGCRAAMLQGAENVKSRCTTQTAPVLDSLPKIAESRCSNSPAIPDGWKPVPVEPTPEMQSAAAGAIRFDTTPINNLWTGNAVYKAMLAAAPQQEVK